MPPKKNLKLSPHKLLRDYAGQAPFRISVRNFWPDPRPAGGEMRPNYFKNSPPNFSLVYYYNKYYNTLIWLIFSKNFPGWKKG